MLLVYLQDGRTPAFAASQNGHTKSLELLLSNNADVNAAANVQQFELF
jgi:ankyrin repeat protein